MLLRTCEPFGAMPGNHRVTPYTTCAEHRISKSRKSKPTRSPSASLDQEPGFIISLGISSQVGKILRNINFDSTFLVLTRKREEIVLSRKKDGTRLKRQKTPKAIKSGLRQQVSKQPCTLDVAPITPPEDSPVSFNFPSE